MIISHSLKFIFFSNPKTGSESIRALLAPYQEEDVRPYWQHEDLNTFYPHMTPDEAKQAFVSRGLPFHDYFRFSFTRNPWARLVSLFEMDRSRGRITSRWDGRLRRDLHRLTEIGRASGRGRV